MMNYMPTPLDTNDVLIPNDLMELTEKIAQNTHDVWALGRIKEGWKYGKERNDAAKTNPCLVPYSELPESEKEYDRNTSLETIKVILKLGYKIIPEEESAREMRQV